MTQKNQIITDLMMLFYGELQAFRASDAAHCRDASCSEEGCAKYRYDYDGGVMKSMSLKIGIRLLALTMIIFLISACSTVGTGRNTMVLAKPTDGTKYKGEEFNHMLSETQNTELRAMGVDEPLPLAQWQELGIASAGQGNDGSVMRSVSVSLRDRTRTPPFSSLSLDLAEQDEFVKIFLDPSIDNNKKRELIEKARHNFVTLPEVQDRVVFDRYLPIDYKDEDFQGAPVWRYFAELEIDLTGSLASPDPLVTFSYLATILRIPDNVDAKFINFSPKEADLYAIAIGQLTSSGALTGNITQGVSGTAETAQTDTTQLGLQNTNESTRSITSQAGLTGTLSEQLTREIKAGLDVRSAGIHDDGKVFLIELRGTDQKRIAGTYTFKVMLEVRSFPTRKEKVFIAKPDANAIKLETRTVGVIRHVVKRGQVGMIHRVPEPLNDHAFHEVIVEDDAIDVWQFNGLPRGDIIEPEAKPKNVLVRTAHDDAAFYVREIDGKVIGYGSGKQAAFHIEKDNVAEVVFLPIIRNGDSPFELVAETENIDAPDDGTVTVVAKYQIKRSSMIRKE